MNAAETAVRVTAGEGLGWGTETGTLGRRAWGAGSWLEGRAQAEFVQCCLARAGRDEAHLAWGCGRRVEGTIRGSAASASDHLHLGPGRGLRRRGTGVRARGGRGWGSGLGLPASHTTHAGSTHEHLGPHSMHLCVHTYTRLGAHLHTHVPFGLITLTHALQSHASSHSCPHGMEKGRSRRGGAELGKGQLSPDPAAEADPLDAEAPARPSGLAAGARSTGLAKRAVATDGASAY